MNTEKLVESYAKIGDRTIPYYRINNDMYGNPRYVTHAMSLGIKSSDYGKIKGLTRYRGKWIHQGYVFQSYNIQDDLEHAVRLVNEFYEH